MLGLALDIAMALICEQMVKDKLDNTFYGGNSPHKTHKLKSHFSHQKCAKKN
jgi:hypothetical protein